MARRFWWKEGGVAAAEDSMFMECGGVTHSGGAAWESVFFSRGGLGWGGACRTVRLIPSTGHGLS